MNARVAPSEVIDGVYYVHPDSAVDDRGRFTEIFREEWVPGARKMVQVNRSESKANVLRGMHYHLFQADYWYVPRGRALVVLHDLRDGSPTEGATLTLEIGDENEAGVFIPPGVAHGFAALTDLTITYLVDQYYNPDDELGVAWDDPEIGADWQLTDPVVSKRDQTNPSRAELPAGRRPYFGLRT